MRTLVIVGVSSICGHHKNQILASMLGALAKTDQFPQEHAKEVLQTLLERERLGSTVLGRGIFMPRAQSPGVPQVIVVVAEMDSPLTIDGQQVMSIIMVLGPKNDNPQSDGPAEFLATLAKVGDLLRREEFPWPSSKAADPERETAELVATH